jgi:hypothetical protein
MIDLVGFIFILVVLVLSVIWWRFGSIRVGFNYLRKKAGPRMGVLTFIGGFILLAILGLGIRKAYSADFSYFQYAEAFAGVEWSINNPSHECRKDGPDEHTVSNGGVRINIFNYAKFLDVNLKWQHNSCAFNEDWIVRDYVGTELVIPIFDRRNK